MKNNKIRKIILVSSISIVSIGLFSFKTLVPKTNNDWIEKINMQEESWVESNSILSADLLIVCDDKVVLNKQSKINLFQYNTVNYDEETIDLYYLYFFLFIR